MFQVHRTDTGQFVLIDPATGVVVIEDELQAGYDHIEALAAERPAKPIATTQPERPGPDSPFEFRGRRNLTLVLTIGLPFIWLLFVYLALRDLERPGGDVDAKIEALQVQVSNLQDELGQTHEPPKKKHKQKKRDKPERSEKGGAESTGKASLPTKSAQEEASKRKRSAVEPTAKADSARDSATAKSGDESPK